MTPPKGPAERAAEKLAEELGVTCPIRRRTILEHYASIEQENQRLEEQMVGQRRAIRHEQTRVDAYQQENQRLREALEQISNCTDDALVYKIAEEALATDKREP